MESLLWATVTGIRQSNELWLCCWQWFAAKVMGVAFIFNAALSVL